MKSFPTFIKHAAIILLAVVLSGVSASANTYTAAASGSWSSSATWAGGIAPSYNNTNDQITIPVGIDVAIGNNLSINGAGASLTVLGSLTDSLSDTLTIGLGSVIGTGSIAVHSLALDATSTLVFTGTIAVQTMTTSSTNLSLAAHITVAQALYLTGGILSVQSGGNLDLAQNSTIVLSGGSVTNNGGLFALTGAYNVAYYQSSGSSTTSGIELGGTGLRNLTVNVASGNSVMLASDVTVNGSLSMNSGMLVLNSHNLTINGNVASGGTGTISSSGSSDLTIHTDSSTSGNLTFTSDADTLRNLSVNTGGHGTANIGSDLYINGSLSFSGSTLNMNSYGLHLNAAATVSGADSNDYIIATGGGYVSAQMSSGSSTWTTFPIGSHRHYSPLSAQRSAGSVSGSVSAYVSDGVYSHGISGSGTDLSQSEAVVDMTYFVEPDSNIGTSGSLNLRLMWSASMEANGFNHDSAYITHFTNSAWDTISNESITAQGSLYVIERDSITSFSPFAVVDKSAKTSTTSINEINAVDFTVYPNPASDHIVVSGISGGSAMTMDIMSVTGQHVGTYTISNANNTVSVNYLTAGDYFVRLSNDKVCVVKKFVKI